MERLNRRQLIKLLEELRPSVLKKMVELKGDIDRFLRTKPYKEYKKVMKELHELEIQKYGFPFTQVQWGQVDILNDLTIYVYHVFNTHTPQKSERKFYKRAWALHQRGFNMFYQGLGEFLWYYGETDPLNRLLMYEWYSVFVIEGHELDMDEDGRPPETIFQEEVEVEEQTPTSFADIYSEIAADIKGLKPPKMSEGKLNVAEFGRDLNEEVKKGLMDPCIGRDDELIKMEMILSRRKKNNPIVLGKAGVGKSQLVYGLAERITRKGYAGPLKGKRIVELNVSKLMSGGEMRYVGELANRINKVIDAVKDSNIILFIDELHTMMGAGSSEGYKNGDIGNMLKPYLADGRITMIGATTTNEFSYIIQDPAMERRFNKVEIQELTVKETTEILKQLTKIYSEHHNVAYNANVLRLYLMLVRITLKRE